MHARLELQLGEGAAPSDLGDDFLVAAHRAFARRHDLDLPAVLGGEALVHPEQVAGEQRGLIAAGAGADFQNDVALVHRIFRHQRLADVLRERVAPRLQRRLLGLGERAHVAIRPGIVQHRVEVGDLALDRAVGLDRLDRRRQLGELARQPHEGVALGPGGEFVLDGAVTRKERIELWRGEHHQSCRPSACAKSSSALRTVPFCAEPSSSGATSAAAFLASRSSTIAFTGPTAEAESDSER